VPRCGIRLFDYAAGSPSTPAQSTASVSGRASFSAISASRIAARQSWHPPAAPTEPRRCSDIATGARILECANANLEYAIMNKDRACLPPDLAASFLMHRGAALG